MTIEAIPKGYHAVTPYLWVQGIPTLIDFLKQAFGAEEINRHVLPDGTVMNAEVKIGDSPIMMGETPKDRQPMPAMFYMYVSNADAVYNRAIQAGGKSISEPTDQFYGDRTGAVEDPSGNQWWVATHKEDVSDEELIRRASQRKR